jgi:hypothetical protein
VFGGFLAPRNWLKRDGSEMNERADQGGYTLSREQVTQALTILREERGAHPITPKQIRSFQLFRVSFWVFWALDVCLIVVVVSGDRLPSFVLDVLSPILLMAMVACSVPLLISIRGTWSLFRRTWRQFRLARKTGLWSLLKAKSGRPWWWRLILWIVLIPFLAVLLFFALAIPIVGSLMLFAIPVYIFVHYVGPRIKLLADARGLQNLLEQKVSAAEGSATDFVRIPSSDFDKLARIEDEQILRRRAEAIETVAAEKPTYALLKSRTILTEAAQLDEETRLRVETYFRRLATDPNPAEATREADGTVWHLRVPETTLETLYVVDDVARRVELLSLRSLGQETPFFGQAETPHA